MNAFAAHTYSGFIQYLVVSRTNTAGAFQQPMAVEKLGLEETIFANLNFSQHNDSVTSNLSTSIHAKGSLTSWAISHADEDLRNN